MTFAPSVAVAPATRGIAASPPRSWKGRIATGTMTAAVCAVAGSALRPTQLLVEQRPRLDLEAAIPDGRVYLERVKPSPLLPAWGLARSEAFVLAAEGRGAEAAARRDEALRLLDREQPSGMTAFVREQLAGVR